MLKKTHDLVLLFLLGTLIVCFIPACSDKTSNTSLKPDFVLLTENCRSIKHAVGETCVRLNSKRIVVLDNVTLENTLALDQKPVGGPLKYVNPVVRKLTGEIVDVGTEGGVSLERILALKPDLILGLAHNAQLYPQLSQIAPTVLVSFEHSGEWKEISTFLGEVLGKSEQVEQLMAKYSHRLKDFKARMVLGTSARKNRLKQSQVSVVRLYPDKITLYTKPGFIGTVLEDADLLRPPSQDLNLEKTQALTGDTIQYSISKEVFDKADGDAIFVMVGNWDSKIHEVLTFVKADPLWLKLDAVRQDKVYEVGDHWVGSSFIAANAVLDDLEKYLINIP
jgi:iron complex transport system substrate-binding protein